MADGMPKGRRRSWALACVSAALVIDILDLTIVNVAIPSLRTRFGASEAAVQWLIAGYAGLFATLLVTGGRLGDVFGYRRMLVTGLSAFVLASALCGLAPDPSALVLARLLQGAAAAMVVPQINAMVQLLYPPHERVSALALFGVLGGAAAVAGPVLGGVLIGADLWGLGWRPIFLVNVPIGLATIAGAFLLLPATRASDRPQLDWGGTALVTMTLAAALVPLVQGREQGWPWWCVALALLAPPLAYATIRHARARAQAGKAALIVLPLFREPSFAIGLGLIALFQSAVAGFLFILTLMLQQGLGYSAARAGFAHIPFALGVSFGIALLARRLVPRFRTTLISIGALAMATGLAVLALTALGGNGAPWSLAPGMLIAGLGMGLVSGPLAPIALSEIDIAQAGAASGTLKATQELGGAIGVAAIGSLFFALAGRSGGHRTLIAFGWTAAVLAATLIAGAIAARRLPRDLKVFGAPAQRSVATSRTGPSNPEGLSGASAE